MEKFTISLAIIMLYVRLIASVMVDISLFQLIFNIVYDYFSKPESNLLNKGLLEIIISMFGMFLLLLSFNFFVLVIPISIITVFIKTHLKKLNLIYSYLLVAVVFVFFGIIINNGLGHSLGMIGGQKIEDYRLIIYALVGALSFVLRMKNTETFISQNN